MGTSKVFGEMISREASMIAVARFAFETWALGSLRERLSEGKMSWTQSAIRFAGSGCLRRRARWLAE